MSLLFSDQCPDTRPLLVFQDLIDGLTDPFSLLWAMQKQRLVINHPINDYKEQCTTEIFSIRF